jgi:hypothetical protein
VSVGRGAAARWRAWAGRRGWQRAFYRLRNALTLPGVARDVHLFHITCGGCTAGWAGEDRAHCGRCHVTYDSILLFDTHRADGICRRPRVLGLVPTKNGIWRQPALGQRGTG